MWEQLEIAAQYQHYWADNSVSITVTFKPEEAHQIKDALEMYETRLKAVSFLRYEETGYEQAPYEPITKEQYEDMIKNVTPIQRIETNEGEREPSFVQMTLAKFRRDNVINTRKSSSIGCSNRRISFSKLRYCSTIDAR